MKILYIVRHAKSSWSNPGLTDKERPLNNRGKMNAPEMGARLVDNQIKPDIMISSPAKRARSTAKKIAKIIQYPKKEIVISDELYHAGEQTMLGLIQSQKNEFDHVMIFGHNPGFTDFANDLCGISIYNIPTSGIVGIKFNVDRWDQVDFRTGELLFFDYPKKAPSSYNL